MEYLGLDDLLLHALKEDVGTGDITTNSCVPEENISEGEFIAKADGVICGIDVAKRVFALVNPTISFKALVKDGDVVSKGQVLAEISGSSRGILTGERIALNLMQRLSGTATATYKAVKQVEGTKTRIVDTRKTTPFLRTLEKYAVRCGGGCNHRFNLADGVLIKDNHIKAAGSIKKAVENAKRAVPHVMKIEVEIETFEQMREALDAHADIIMLDNMTVAEMAEAVKFIDGRAITEASGNMGERDLKEVATAGVDIISIGALTHSVVAMDISLKFK